MMTTADRTCATPGCTASLRGRHGNAKYCVPCAGERKREWQRRRCAGDPAYAERQREYMREYKRRRRAGDPAYAERQRERERERQRNRELDRLARTACPACGSQMAVEDREEHGLIIRTRRCVRQGGCGAQ